MEIDGNTDGSVHVELVETPSMPINREERGSDRLSPSGKN